MAASRPARLYKVPTTARSSSSNNGTFTAPGICPRANSPGERTSTMGVLSSNHSCMVKGRIMRLDQGQGRVPELSVRVKAE